MNFHRQESANKGVIGILGGTFDPIHFGHIQLAEAAHEQYQIPEIWVMPSGDPSSYKDTRQIASAVDRCNMVRAAIEGYPYMKLSLLEVERSGRTYTSDTLAALTPHFSRIFFIIGADSLFALQDWHKPDYVLSHCCMLAANRSRHSRAELEAQKSRLESLYNADIRMLELPDLPYSSTEIRKRAAGGFPLEGMVPGKVEDYIYRHKLYISTDGEYK